MRILYTLSLAVVLALMALATPMEAVAGNPPVACFNLTPSTLPQPPSSADTLVRIRFVGGDDMLYIPWAGNGTELERLFILIDRFHDRIAEGRIPIRVDGYCASLPTRKENLKTAFIRANRVKSELITRKGLREEHFITKNHVSDYNGHKDVVVVTISVPAAILVPVTEGKTHPEQEHKQEQASNTESDKDAREIRIAGKDVPKEAENAFQDTCKQQPGTVIPETPASRYIAVKTNLAAWAGTIVNIAADVQVGRHISVELPVLWCPWYASGEHAVKTFTIQPEGRWWLSRPGEGHFFGVHAHMGWYSVKWKRDRYQDTGRPLLGAGISYGYLLPFNAHWAGEFTLGAGYANTRYDTYYNIDNGARIDTRTKNYWGITRVGISVVYRFNLKKQ